MKTFETYFVIINSTFILMSFVSKNILIKFRGFFLKNFSFSDQALILIY